MAATRFPSTPGRRALATALGSLGFVRLPLRRLWAIAALVMLGASYLVSRTARVWPSAADPAFDPPTNPAVRLDRTRLLFDGTVPWVGKDVDGSVTRAIGDPLPTSLPVPYVHYGPDVVTLRGSQGTKTLAPDDLERDTRRGLWLGHLFALLAMTGLLGFAGRLVGRLRSPLLGGGAVAHLTLASFVPAGLLGGLIGAFAPSVPFTMEVVTAAILAANLMTLLLDPAWVPLRKETRP